MGDQLNMDSLSHWNESKRKLIEGKRVWEEYRTFDEDILKPLEKTGAKIVWIQGNHEDWARQYVERHPELEGMIEPELCLKLKERGIQFIPFNESYFLGKLEIKHGNYTNDNHAKKTVTVHHKNVTYAHTHTYQVYTKERPPHDKDFHIARSIPVLSEFNPDYMKMRPHRWIPGFSIVYMRDDKFFHQYDIIIVKDSFILNNHVYR